MLGGTHLKPLSNFSGPALLPEIIDHFLGPNISFNAPAVHPRHLTLREVQVRLQALCEPGDSGDSLREDNEPVSQGFSGPA